MPVVKHIDLVAHRARPPVAVNWLRCGVTLLIASCFWTTTIRAQDGPRVGLVMAGEGADALASVGVLKRLEEAGVRVDIIAATGMAGVIGGLYATGLTAGEIENTLPALTSVLAFDSSSASFPPSYPVDRLVTELFAPFDLSGVTLDRLPLPLIITSRELETGQQVVFNSGPLTPAIRATLSSVWLAAPVQFDGRTFMKGRGIPPIDAVRQAGADIVIVVDTAMLYTIVNDPANKVSVMQALLRAEGFEQSRREIGKLFEDDLLIRPTGRIGDAIDAPTAAEIIRQSYEDLASYDDEFEALARAQQHDTARISDRRDTRRQLPDRWRLYQISIDGFRFVPAERVATDFAIGLGAEFGLPDLLAALDALNATGFYEFILPRFHTAAGAAAGLTISIKESVDGLPIEALDNLVAALNMENDGAPDEARARSRMFAITAIGNIGAAAETAVDELVALLADDEQVVRQASIIALGKMGTAALPHLPAIRTFVLQNKPSALAVVAANALAQLSVTAAEADRIDVLAELTESMAALDGVAGAEPSIQSIRLAIQRLETIKASRDRAGDDGGFLVDPAASEDIFAGREEIELNGVEAKVAFDPATRTIKFLGNTNSVRPGLNFIENVRFWLEDRELTRFETPYASSYALIVAIDDYARNNDTLHRGTTGYDSLEHMVENARELSNILSRTGFPPQNITELYDANATKDAIENALRDFWPGGRHAAADRLFVYFGGHGGLASGIPYFVTYDFDRARPTATSFLMEDFSGRESRNLSPKHVIFAIDACHSGLAVTTLGNNDQERARLRNFARLSVIRRDVENPSRNLLVAGTGDQLALYKNGGIFTKALTAGLRGDADLNKDGVIQFEELAFHIRNKVTSEADMLGVSQDPESQILDAYGRGRLLFVPGSAN